MYDFLVKKIIKKKTKVLTRVWKHYLIIKDGYLMKKKINSNE